MKKIFLTITKIFLMIFFLLSVLIVWKTPVNEYEWMTEMGVDTLPQPMNDKTGMRALFVLLPIMICSIISVLLWKHKIGKIFCILCGILFAFWILKFYKYLYIS